MQILYQLLSIQIFKGKKKKANVLSQGWCLDKVWLNPRHAVLSVFWLVLNGTALHGEILLILSVGAF